MDCYGGNNNTVTAGTPVPWGRAWVCFQPASYCTRHLNNSIKINYDDILMQNVRKIVKGSQYQTSEQRQTNHQPVINLQGMDTIQQYKAATSGTHVTTTLINVSKKNNYNTPCGWRP